ncbi:hypothetical protein LAZ67_1001002 [Cordylochernes scorpioides]|uniref:Uncharacterized protein n=1 Tax=Cordylochernes scorpioides TaxID=51811 RepID=A0ABY6JV37_9ARAC|nr:hypothetical protein LAZ67_1001002 [Cordylochernes scorpioides]
MWSMVAQRLTQITSPAATPDQLWQRVEAASSAVPQEHIQSLFKSMPRRVAAGLLVIYNKIASLVKIDAKINAICIEILRKLSNSYLCHNTILSGV